LKSGAEYWGAHLSGQYINQDVKTTASPTFEYANITNDIHVGANIEHIDDTNTRIQFTDNHMELDAGGATFITLEEDPTQDYLLIGDAGGDIDIYMYAGADALIQIDAGDKTIKIDKGHSISSSRISGGTIQGTNSNWDRAYNSGQRVKDLFNHELYPASSATEWQELTSEGETTLHSHAGSKSAPGGSLTDNIGSDGTYGVSGLAFVSSQSISGGALQFKNYPLVANDPNGGDKLTGDTWLTVGIDTVSVGGDGYTVAAGEITLPANGTYLISYSVNLVIVGTTGGPRGWFIGRIEDDVSGWAETEGSAAISYYREINSTYDARSGVSNTCIAQLSAGDKIRLRVFYGDANYSTPNNIYTCGSSADDYYNGSAPVSSWINILKVG